MYILQYQIFPNHALPPQDRSRSRASGLDLQQVSGFTVVAEKLNFLRFISHFRMVHRGSFFAQLKTTTVRKLLPESWGFLCPVHTPG